jgi:ElaB/YqjD/DUF883 family membrane-anchored ribosome-binding protein
MPPQVHELSKSHTTHSDTEAGALAEMRERLGEITSDLSKVAERRTRAARRSVEAGADTMRTTIRRQPVISVGIAALAGALLAVLVVPRAGPARSTSRWSDWAPVSRADLREFADTVQRTMARSMSAVPVSSSLERLVDAVSRVDNSAGLSSTIEKIGAWLQQKAPSGTAKK